MENRWQWLVSFTLLSQAIACAHCDQTEPTGPNEQSHFYVDGKESKLELALDRVGVLLKEGTDAAALDELAKRHQLKRLEPIAEGGLEQLGLAQLMTARQIAKLAEKLKKEAAIIQQAGIVARPIEAKVPMIVPNEIIVYAKRGMDRRAVDASVAAFGGQVVMENPAIPELLLVRLTERAEKTSLEVSNELEKSRAVEYAHPNFLQKIVFRQLTPNDPLFAAQWHHNNTGQSAGTVDADIDGPEAFEISLGLANVLVAVIDSGFDIQTHPDMIPNLYTNPGEIAGNGIDDDANGLRDDVNGWDFGPCSGGATPGCGDNNLLGGSHGTAVAGSVAARGNNNVGVTGSCPLCTVLPIRYSGFIDAWTGALSFAYAQQRGAAIITNSWGYAIGTPITNATVTAINSAATNGRGGLGAVVLFAMNNPNVNDCGAVPDISSLANVIAVARSTNRDRFDLSGFGNCMDLMAPSAACDTVSSGRGTLWATTVDRPGANGYNNAELSFGTCACPTTESATARDYTSCFNGTSFSTPLTAGAAGLVLSVNAALTRQQVQQLLQDTADKVEDSAGAYRTSTGFSAPAGGNATHGWGRVNAFEAVRVAAPPAQGGKNGFDLYLRDNRLDWGNTEQPSNRLFEPTPGFISHWRSEDIKVDAPPHRTPPTATTWDSFVDETPSAVSGDVNHVYLRVHNRGPTTVPAATAKVYWAQFGTALPSLPPDFWTAFPANSTSPTNRWNPLNCSTGSAACTTGPVGYSGASVATTAGDGSQIVRFDFPAPAIDPSLANHFCLLAMVDAPQDRISADARAQPIVDAITPIDNNITHRNYAGLSSSRSERSEVSFIVRNPSDKDRGLAVLSANTPEGWKLELNGPIKLGERFPLEPRQEMVVKVLVSPPSRGATAEIEIIQETFFDRNKQGPLRGGLVLSFAPEQKPEK